MMCSESICRISRTVRGDFGREPTQDVDRRSADYMRGVPAHEVNHRQDPVEVRHTKVLGKRGTRALCDGYIYAYAQFFVLVDLDLAADTGQFEHRLVDERDAGLKKHAISTTVVTYNSESGRTRTCQVVSNFRLSHSGNSKRRIAFVA